MSWQSATDAAQQKACVNEALWSAAKSSAITAALAGAALATANRVSPAFRNALGASGRAAMIVRGEEGWGGWMRRGRRGPFFTPLDPLLPL